MTLKFSEDVIPLSDLKVNPEKVVKHAKDSHRPVLVTSRGRGVAVVQGLEDYEKAIEELAFVKAIATGMLDVKEGSVLNINDVKAKFGIE